MIMPLAAAETLRRLLFPLRSAIPYRRENENDGGICRLPSGWISEFTGSSYMDVKRNGGKVGCMRRRQKSQRNETRSCAFSSSLAVSRSQLLLRFIAIRSSFVPTPTTECSAFSENRCYVGWRFAFKDSCDLSCSLLDRSSARNSCPGMIISTCTHFSFCLNQRKRKTGERGIGF